MNYPPESQTQIQVIWQSSSPEDYPDLASLQVPGIGLSFTLLNPNAVDSEDQAAHKQERPHLVIAFVDPDSTEATTQIHQVHPDAVTIAISAQKSFKTPLQRPETSQKSSTDRH